MNDTYVELLVKRPQNNLLNFVRCFLTVGGIALILVGLISQLLITLAGILVEVAVYFVARNLHIEYEYLYLDKELSIDVIKNQTSRKKLATYNAANLTIMAPKGAKRLGGYDRIKARDFSSGLDKGNPYELVFGGKERICIDTTEELIAALRTCAPRSIYND